MQPLLHLRLIVVFLLLHAGFQAEAAPRSFAEALKGTPKTISPHPSNTVDETKEPPLRYADNDDKEAADRSPAGGARIAMWTAAKPCPQTQAYMGSRIHALGTRRINVKYAYHHMSGGDSWFRSLEPYAKLVNNGEDVPPFNKGFQEYRAEQAARRFLKRYATNADHSAQMLTLKTRCFQDLHDNFDRGTTAETHEQASGLPAANPFTSSAEACAEFCAMAMSSAHQVFASCSVALAHRHNRHTLRAIVALFSRQPLGGWPAIPAFIGNSVTIKVAAANLNVPLALERTIIPGPLRYDTTVNAGIGKSPASATGTVQPRKAIQLKILTLTIFVNV